MIARVKGEELKKTISGTSGFCWNPQIACRTFDDTAFLLLQSRMVSLNIVGTFLWDRFRDGATIDQVLEQLLEEFDTSRDCAFRDVAKFVGELLERELLVPFAA